FKGRKLPLNGDPNVGWRDVGESPPRFFTLFNRPSSLDTMYWSGHFVEKDESYHFTAQSSRTPQASVPIGDSKPISLPLPGVSVGIPSYQNDIAAGFTSRFMMQGGMWSAEDGSGASSGQVLGNQMSGAPVQVKAPTTGGGALPRYEWCDHRSIVDEHISQKLFESILYAGTIGPSTP